MKQLTIKLWFVVCLITACVACITACDLVKEPVLNQSQTLKTITESDYPAFSSNDQASAYALGYDKGRGLASYIKKINALNHDLSVDAIKQGFIDGINEGDKSKLTIEQMKTLIYGLERELALAEHKQVRKQSLINKAQGQQYLTTNKTMQGVIELASGLQYKVITNGTGQSPRLMDKVIVQFVAKTIDGKEVDRSDNNEKWLEPFKITKVIAGWTEALQLMREGDVWQLTVPPSLAYGSSTHGNIAAESVLIFELSLIKVIPI